LHQWRTRADRNKARVPCPSYPLNTRTRVRSTTHKTRRTQDGPETQRCSGEDQRRDQEWKAVQPFVRRYSVRVLMANQYSPPSRSRLREIRAADEVGSRVMVRNQRQSWTMRRPKKAPGRSR